MEDVRQSSALEDSHDLNRFLKAQADSYERALSEIHNDHKCSHWMWYIFPQFDGLGFSATSKKYSIKSIAEANAYLSHPVLGSRLIACALAVLSIKGRSAYEIFGSPDDMKLKSCVTLFAHVSPTGSVFDQLLNKFFQCEHDRETLRLLRVAGENK